MADSAFQARPTKDALVTSYAWSTIFSGHSGYTLSSLFTFAAFHSLFTALTCWSKWPWEASVTLNTFYAIISFFSVFTFTTFDRRLTLRSSLTDRTSFARLTGLTWKTRSAGKTGKA